MVARFTACDKRRLREVLVHDGPGEVESEVAEHIENCASCRRDLELLAGGAEWWSDVQRYLSSADPVVTDPARSGTTRRDDLDGKFDDGKLDSHHFGGWRKQLSFLSPSEQAGSLGRLGPYEITDCIGRGGMGIVVKALDPALNRHVAIKVLAAEWAHNATARRRFAREAQAAAAVVHDHVVPIHAVDGSGEVPFLVMAYIPGRSLQERLDRTGPLELKEILRIGMQTAAGLAAAHAQGLVHRDIKPANILLEDSVERVRITDFGLARAVDDVSQTQSGILAGTPQYMSPEQAAGEAVDHRADLFSLGSVLYAMCTGRSPFRAESTVAVIRRICDGRARPVRDINPDVPLWLAEIIEKLHAKNPADRFQTASEVADLLERHLAHVQQPALSPRPAPLNGSPHPAPDGWRTGRRLLAAGALVAGLVAIAPWAYRVLAPNGPAQDAEKKAADTDPISSHPVAVQGSNARRESSSADNAEVLSTVVKWGTHDTPDARPLEIEFERLSREVHNLDTALHPRLVPANVADGTPALIEIDRRLTILEEELMQTPR
jgi:serine/threonine-protein kinase